MTNKELAISFWNALFTEHDPIKASTFISDNYKQHNPKVPDLKEGFIQWFTSIFEESNNSGIYTEIKSVIEINDKVVK